MFWTLQTAVVLCSLWRGGHGIQFSGQIDKIVCIDLRVSYKLLYAYRIFGRRDGLVVERRAPEREVTVLCP